MAKGVYVGGKGGLPQGHTQLSYIESSGAQYIDTGIIGKSGLKVKGRFSPSVIGASIPIGCFNPQRFYMLSLMDTNAARYGYVDWYTSNKVLEVGKWYEFEIDFSAGNQSLKIDGVTVVSSTNATTFTNNYNVFVFAYNDSGTAGDFFKGKFEYLQFFDAGGALLRDYVADKNASGVVGLYDRKNKVFYPNKGTGSFIAGEPVAISDNVARNTAEIDIGVTAVAREVIYGHVGVSGVAREFWQGGKRLGNAEIGSSVYLNIDGVPREFIVVQQGLPSASYDESCNGTWLLMKDIYTKMMYDSLNSNNYDNSEMDYYLRNQFFQKLDASVQAKVINATIPCCKGLGSSDIIEHTAPVFLLSGYELGWVVGITYDQIPAEGTCLEYFKGFNNRGGAEPGLVAYYNNVATQWYTRTPWRNNRTSVFSVTTTGTCTADSTQVAHGVRPALILPFDIRVSSDMLIE